MARYNVRDMLGHWIRPRSAQGKMCPHACCRNKRVHPDNMPVILPNRLLRRVPDDDLAEHFRDIAHKQGTEAERGRAQILHEMDRRDERDKRRAVAAERRRGQAVSRKLERAEAVEQAWAAAEEATKGNMLNRAGQAAGISDRSLFTGPESRARRYASEELLEHWRTHPRPTGAMFAGKDTRVYERYTERTRSGRALDDFWVNRRVGTRRR